MKIIVYIFIGLILFAHLLNVIRIIWIWYKIRCFDFESAQITTPLTILENNPHQNKIRNLILLMGHKEVLIREDARSKLLKLSKSSDATISLLLEALNSNNFYIQRDTIYLLGVIKDIRALPAIEEKLGEELEELNEEIYEYLQFAKEEIERNTPRNTRKKHENNTK